MAEKYIVGLWRNRSEAAYSFGPFVGAKAAEKFACYLQCLKCGKVWK